MVRKSIERWSSHTLKTHFLKRRETQPDADAPMWGDRAATWQGNHKRLVDTVENTTRQLEEWKFMRTNVRAPQTRTRQTKQTRNQNPENVKQPPSISIPTYRNLTYKPLFYFIIFIYINISIFIILSCNLIL